MVLLDTVKNELQWGDDIAVPIANSENKKLEDEVQKRISEVTSLKSKLDIQIEHVAAITNYLSSIQETLHETQSLCQSKKQEIENEKHFQALLTNEERCLAQEIGHQQKELDKLMEKKSKHSNVIKNLEEKLDTLKEDIHWDQKALDSWLQEAIKKDDDANLLATFMNEDASKMKELNLQLTVLATEEQQHKKLLDRTAVELKITQMDLDKTSQEFKERHQERQHFLSQWQTTIQHMQKRDSEVEAMIKEISEIKDQIDTTRQQCKETELSYEKQTKENRESERNVGAKERLVSKLQQQQTKEDDKQQSLHKDVELLKVQLNQTKDELRMAKWNTEQLEKFKAEQESRLQRENDERESLIWQLEHASETAMTAEDMFQQLEMSASQERAANQQLQREATKLQEMHAEELKHIQLLINKQKQVSLEIEGLKKLTAKYEITLQRLDRETTAQQQILATKEEELSLLTDQYKSMMGKQSRVEKIHENEDKIQLLIKMLEEKQADCQVLTQETKQQQDELRMAHRDLEKCEKQKEDCNVQLGAIILHNDVAKKTLKDINAKKQQLLVDENILKLEVRRLREIITNKSMNVLSLEKHRLHLEATIQKRQEETDIEEQTLKTEIRLIEEGRQRLANELNDCVLRTNKLKKRCEIMSFPLKSWKWDEEEIAPVHFLMKAAEDKDTLKREHADMKNKLISAEKDLQAFENNSQLLATKTAAMRIAINSNNENDEFAEETKSRLEDEMQWAIKNLELKRKQLQYITANLIKRKTFLEQIKEEESSCQASIAEKQNQLSALDEDLRELDAKMIRANRQVNSLGKQLERSSNFSFIKEDTILRLVKENNKKVVMDISDLLKRFPEICDSVNDYFDKVNLPRPSQSGTSRTQSVASSGSVASLQSVVTLPSLSSFSRGSTPARSDRKTPPSTASSTASLPSVVNLTFDDFHQMPSIKPKSHSRRSKEEMRTKKGF